MRDNELNPMLGIDLGTTFSSIARWDGRGPQVCLTRMGKLELQSAVHYDPATKEFLVGELAFRKGIVTPENLAIGIKRHMDDADRKITIGGREFSPIELSAIILDRLYRGVAEKFPAGQFKARGTVVTVPYYFKAHQCENTRKAAEKANIGCMGIIQEPIAASLCYAWQLVHDHPENIGKESILVFDLGGGTFDLTLFDLEHTPKKLSFEVVATGGDDRLGGMDFDDCMVKLLLEKAKLSLEGLPEKDVRKARQKLLSAAREAKEALSFENETYVAIPYVIGAESIETKVTRDEFNETIEPFVRRIEGIIESLWARSGKGPGSMQRVILVGGSSAIPCIKTLLGDIIGANKVYEDREPSLTVVKGAAMYAAYLDDRGVLGREVVITTRTCHALGVELNGGMFDIVIAANRQAPCKGESLFCTSEENQVSLRVNVYQGAQPLVKDNTLIGTIHIGDLPPRPKGKLEIPVTFDISKNQNLTVTVKVIDEETKELLREEISAFTFA